jgi:DNA replication initiation complex subunit (GINS family)
MKNILLTDEIFDELKRYLERELSNAENNLVVAQINNEYYKDIEEYQDDLKEDLNYCQGRVKRYKLALESFIS